MTPEAGFWFGVAWAVPIYFGLDHYLIPFLVDVWRTFHARIRVT